MKLLLAASLALALGGRAAASFDEWEPDSAQESAAPGPGDEESQQPQLQESPEDLADFVTDYIRRDVQLKGAFFIEDKASGKVLRLSLLAVGKETTEGADGSRAVTARFKDAAGREYPVLFWLRDAPWGGLDIFRLELKAPPAQAKVKK